MLLKCAFIKKCLCNTQKTGSTRITWLAFILIHHLSPYFKDSTDILIQTENCFFPIKIFKICLSILWNKTVLCIYCLESYFLCHICRPLIYCCMFCHPGLIFYEGVLNGLFGENFILAGSFPCWQFFRTE